MGKHEKRIEDLWTARFARRARGRIAQRDARELGRRWRDLAVRRAEDNLAGRAPFAAGYADAKKYGPDAVFRFSQSRRDRFYFYGPRSNHWPGDTLVLVVGGWRTMCAAGCPCGRCFRPAVPLTLAIVDANRPTEDETHAEYVARLSASHGPDGPSVARASERPASPERAAG